MLVLMQVVPFLGTQPAFGETYWDAKEKIAPDHKANIRELPHVVKNGREKEKSIPYLTIHVKGGAKHVIQGVPSMHLRKGVAEALAKIVSPQKLSSSGSFEGLGYDNVTPPDVQIGAGPLNIMEMVNLEGQTWSANGTPQGQPFYLSAFFNTGNDFISDPKVFYDNQSGRWISSITDVSTSSVKVAVSDSNDAAGGFCIYTIQGPSNAILDQPIIGSSDDKIIVSTNDFNSFTQQFMHVQYWVLNKSEMLSCSPVDFVTQTSASYFSVHPVQSLTATTTQYMVSTSSTNAGSNVSVFSINGVPPNPVTVSVRQLPVSSISNPPNAFQKGTFLQLDTGDYRVQDAAWSNGTLWLADNDACTPAGDIIERSCLHLMELDTGSMSVKQDFEYGITGKYLFYPALRELPDGNLVITYGFSSLTDYPAVGVTEHATTDPKNSVEAPELLQSGKGPVDLLFSCVSFSGCRYGDYFGAALDPAHPDKVWIAGEYGSGTLSYSGLGYAWTTKVGSFTG